MRTIKLIEGVTLTATEKTLRKAQELVNYYVNQAALLDELNRAWEMGEWDYYSDLHKDLFGVRPHTWSDVGL